MMKVGNAIPATSSQTAVHASLGDPDVREGLTRHAADRLAKLLPGRPRTMRDELVKDAVQEVGRRALDGVSSFDPVKGHMNAWLHGILDLVLYENCRALQKRPVQPCAAPKDWDEIESRLTANDGLETLRKLLALLPEEHRRIVTMHHLDELPHEEIAAELGISPGNSRVRLARAMIELKRIAAREDV